MIKAEFFLVVVFFPCHPNYSKIFNFINQRSFHVHLLEQNERTDLKQSRQVKQDLPGPLSLTPQLFDQESFVADQVVSVIG